MAEKYNTATPAEILVLLVIIYVCYRIATTLYPLLFKRFDEKLADIEGNVERLENSQNALQSHVDVKFEKLETNLRGELKGVVGELRSMLNEFKTYITQTEVLKNRVKALEHRVEKLENKEK